MPALKIYVLDDQGNKLSCKEAAELDPGLTAGKVGYYVSSKGAKTMSDVMKEFNAIKEHGIHHTRTRIKYDTIFGPLTSREIWERHKYKDRVTVGSIRTRLSVNGGMHDGLWQDVQNNKVKRDSCKSKDNSDIKCMMVRPGELVRSCGKLYSVSECHAMRYKKGKVAAFRVMENGQVLVNTTIDLGNNWSKVIP